MSVIYPAAIWRPVTNFGYPQGTHGQLAANGPRGAFFHDAQGFREGAYQTFNTPGRGGAHFIINFDGPPWQFIDCGDAAWHCGGYTDEPVSGFHGFANLYYWGFEFEGGFPTPEPITDYQIAIADDICSWLATRYGFHWKAVRHEDLWEHGEVYPTSCPNGRIRWPEVIAALKGEEDMGLTAEERKVLEAQTAMLNTLLARVRKAAVRMADHPEVYELTADELLHIPDLATLRAKKITDADIEVLPASSPVWKMTAVYPAGVPRQLGGPS